MNSPDTKHRPHVVLTRANLFLSRANHLLAPTGSEIVARAHCAASSDILRFSCYQIDALRKGSFL